MNPTTSTASGQTIMQIVPILLIIVLFYALVVFPQKKRQKKMNEFLDALKIGDRVVTGWGGSWAPLPLSMTVRSNWKSLRKLLLQ